MTTTDTTGSDPMPETESTTDGRAGARASRALVLLAGISAWLSYASVRSVAIGVFGRVEGSAFPLLLDTGVYVASEFYLATVRARRPQAGFRLLAHALVAVTVALNVSAAHDLRAALYHAVPPALFAALVELKARRELRTMKAAAGHRERIPLRLWLTAPVDSFRLSLWVARGASHGAVRSERERHLTAVRALRIAVPGRRGTARTARSLVRRQLRAGTLAPADLVAATGLDRATEGTGPDAVLRVALRAALGASASASDHAEPSAFPRASKGASRVRIQTASAAGQAASGEPLVMPPLRRVRPASEGASKGAGLTQEMKTEGLDLDRQALAETGRTVSMRALQRALTIGQERATELRAWLDAQHEQLAEVETP